MTLPLTGPISFVDIRDEFGDTNPVALNEFYAGGGVVPIGTGSVPVSGSIGLAHFRGQAGSVLTGANWRTKNVGFSTMFVDTICVNGTTLLGPNNYISYNGGFTWIREPNYIYRRSVCVINNTYYMYYGSIMSQSTDGTNWTTSTTQPTYSSNAAMIGSVGYAYGSLVYIRNALNGGGSSATDFSSDLGVTWSPLKTFGAKGVHFIANAPAGIALGGQGLFVGLDYPESLSGFAMTSHNAMAWTTRYVRDTQGSTVRMSGNGTSVLFKNVFYAFVAKSSTILDDWVIVSTDGVNFLAVPLEMPGGLLSKTILPLVAAGPDYMFAVYQNSAGSWVSAWSTDGVNWTAGPGLSIGATNLVYANGYWQVYNSTVNMLYIPA